jgi:hypothetical protein
MGGISGRINSASLMHVVDAKGFGNVKGGKLRVHRVTMPACWVRRFDSASAGQYFRGHGIAHTDADRSVG